MMDKDEQPTLLDQFAMAALTGLLMNNSNNYSAATMAQVACNLAFLMTVERGKQ